MRETRDAYGVDAADGFAEDASGTGALQAGTEAETAWKGPPSSH
jgi:hypothetical protein